jgi:hypothetical protein
MTFTKAAIKFILRRNIVMLLLLANIGAFALTNSIFKNANTSSVDGKKDLISKMYTGWQMLDWSFSLIDYLSDVSDR